MREPGNTYDLPIGVDDVLAHGGHGPLPEDHLLSLPIQALPVDHQESVAISGEHLTDDIGLEYDVVVYQDKP